MPGSRVDGEDHRGGVALPVVVGQGVDTGQRAGRHLEVLSGARRPVRRRKPCGRGRRPRRGCGCRSPRYRRNRFRTRTFRPYAQSRARCSVSRVTVYALNLCDIADRDEYLAYSKRSRQEVAKHGGHVVAARPVQRRRSPATSSRARCSSTSSRTRTRRSDSYCNDAELADLQRTLGESWSSSLHTRHLFAISTSCGE